MRSDRQIPWHESPNAPSPRRLQAVNADGDRSGLEETVHLLTEELQQYRMLYESIPSIYFTLNAAGEILNINQFGAARLGYGVQELIAQTIFSLFHPQDQQLLQAAIAVSIQYPNQVANWEFRAFCKDKQYLWVNVTVRAVRGFGEQLLEEVSSAPTQLLNLNNKNVTILFVCEDITERKRVEEALRDIEYRYYTLAKMSPVGIFHLDTTQHCLYANERWREMAGMTLGEVLGEGWIAALHPEDRESFLAEFQLVRQAHRPTESEFRLCRRDGGMAWVFGQIVVEKNSQEEIVGFIGTMTDITERKLSEEALRQRADRERLMALVRDRIRQSLNLEDILQTTVAEVRQFLGCDRVLICHFAADLSGVVVVESVGEGWKPALGISFKDPCFAQQQVFQDYLHGCIRAIEDINAIPASDCYRKFLAPFQVRAKLVVPILQSSVGLKVLPGELTPIPHQSTSHQCAFNPSCLPNAEIQDCVTCPTPTEQPATQNSALWGLLIAHQCHQPRQWQSWEIELLSALTTQVGIAIQQAQLYQQLQVANQKLEQLAARDGLTQLANRRRFDEYLEQEWRRLSREKAPLSLILCDIDFFKSYNDTYGHLAGDFCLRQVASAILSAVKRPADLAARYGGEEFAAILPNTLAAGAMQLAEAIRHKIHQLAIAHANSPVSHYISVSLGVASIVPSRHILPATLIGAADDALYQAKAQGRNRTVFQEC